MYLEKKLKNTVPVSRTSSLLEPSGCWMWCLLHVFFQFKEPADSSSSCYYCLLFRVPVCHGIFFAQHKTADSLGLEPWAFAWQTGALLTEQTWGDNFIVHFMLYPPKTAVIVHCWTDRVGTVKELWTVLFKHVAQNSNGNKCHLVGILPLKHSFL